MTRPVPGACVLRLLVMGLRRAGARPALIGAIWVWHLALGLTLAVPFFRWLYEVTAYRPAADVLAGQFSFGLLAELRQHDTTSMLAILSAGGVAGLLVATLTSPLLVAAVLTSLRNRTLASGELAYAAVSLYWPFLRVIVFGRLAALAGAFAVAAALRPALRPLTESSWEAGWLWAVGIRVTAAGLVAVLLLASVDFALVRLEAQQSRKGFNAWVAGLRFAGSHAMLTLGLWAGVAVLLASAVGVFVALRENTTAAFASLPTLFVVTAAVILQQLFMLTRTWLRVGLLGAEQHAFAQHGAVPVVEPGPGHEPEMPSPGAAPAEESQSP